MRQCGILPKFRLHNPIQVRQIGQTEESRHDQGLGTDRARRIEQNRIGRHRIHQNGMVDQTIAEKCSQQCGDARLTRPDQRDLFRPALPEQFHRAENAGNHDPRNRTVQHQRTRGIMIIVAVNRTELLPPEVAAGRFHFTDQHRIEGCAVQFREPLLPDGDFRAVFRMGDIDESFFPADRPVMDTAPVQHSEGNFIRFQQETVEKRFGKSIGPEDPVMRCGRIGIGMEQFCGPFPESLRSQCRTGLHADLQFFLQPQIGGFYPGQLENTGLRDYFQSVIRHTRHTVFIEGIRAGESGQTAEEIPAEPAEMTAAELVWKLSLLDRCMTREKLSEAFGREPEDKQESSNVVYEYQFDGGVTLRLWGDPVLRAALQYNDRAFEILL